MWVNVSDEPVDTYGKHAELFELKLEYKNYYGHYHYRTEEIICMWDSVNECFWELQTNKEVDERDIKFWWKEE